MLAFFAGITKCPGIATGNPPEGSYIVEQVLGTPCSFRDASANLLWQVVPGWTSLVFAADVGDWFQGLVFALCVDFFNNGVVACGNPFDAGAIGTGQMSMEAIEEVPWKLTDDYNLVPTDETWYNQWLLDSAFPPDKVIGLYNTKYRANVLVKYES